MKNLKVAFEKLISYRDRKLEERKKSSYISYQLIEKGLNKRQADLLGYLYRKEKSNITLKAYSERHSVVRQTASKDLNELIKIGLLKEDKSAKQNRYRVENKELIDNYILNKRA